MSADPTVDFREKASASSLVARLPPIKDWPSISPTTNWLLATVMLSIALALFHSPLAPVPGLVALLLVPGATVMSYFGARPANTAGRVVLAVCLSMMVIMVVGGIASLVGPHIGISRPLDVLPEFVIWFFLAVLILRIGVKRHDPITWIFEGVHTSQIYCGMMVSALAILSILGVAQLNHTGDARLAAFATTLDVIVLLLAVVGGWRRTSTWPLNTILYFASFALLLSTSLRGGNLYGWDIHQEFGDAWNTVQTGVWVIPSDRNPYESMLSLTVLPTILHSLVKLRLLAFFQLVVPAILALLPVAVFTTIRSVPRWITTGRTAPRDGLALAVAVGLIISSVAFASDLVSITRQAMSLTMLTAIVMVLFDRAMPKHTAQIIVGLLIVAISFTHYTTSYLLAAIFVSAWMVSFIWSQGWLGIPRTRIDKHRYDVRPRKIVGVGLVVVSLVAALGWNLVITRNDALGGPSSALTAKGVGLTASTNNINVSPREFERLLVRQFKQSDGWIVPVKKSESVPLKAAATPSTPGVLPGLSGEWQELSYLVVESIWVLLGVSLLYGIFRLGRRRSYEYSADLVGFGVAGLLIGGFLRFSGTLAPLFDPERAAIFTAILLAAPLTLFLDDMVSLLRDGQTLRAKGRIWGVRVASFVWLVVLVVGATGLGALFFGGQAPGSLSGRDWNADEFTVSTPEQATAVWLRNALNATDVVQSDFEGQIVLLSEPGSYHLIPEILPPVVDRGAYVYLSTPDLADHMTEAEAEGGLYVSSFRTTLPFFDKYFYVVYSTGATRVYH